MDTGLEGKGVLVTGGAGGIGRALVEGFAAEGARLAVHYRSSRTAAESLAKAVGGAALPADLTREADADGLVPAAVEALGRLDVCVANAGVWSPEERPVWDLSLERWESVLKANLTATFLTLRAFLRHVASTRSGNAVIVGSTAGLFGEAGCSDYAAAKGGMMTGLLLSAKNEVARLGKGVRVNCVAPGWTVTPMSAGALEAPGALERVTATMPLKKVATPEDVARQVIALASDRVSGHVTGQVVTVAGGMEGRLVR